MSAGVMVSARRKRPVLRASDRHGHAHDTDTDTEDHTHLCTYVLTHVVKRRAASSTACSLCKREDVNFGAGTNRCFIVDQPLRFFWGR
jgi:hypothetical protein